MPIPDPATGCRDHNHPEAVITRTRRVLALALAAVLVIAGCGGDDDPSSDGRRDDGATGATEPGPAQELIAGTEARQLSPATGPAVPSEGCEGSAPTGEVVKERHEVAELTDPDGDPRWYLLTAPDGNEPLPLIVDFHGLSEGAEIHSLMSEMGELGLQEGFVTAFPNGTGQPVAWQVFAEGTDSPELPFVDAVLDDVFTTRCIDTSRVYATGLSNGAMMASMVACTRPDRFAAIAPVAGLSIWDGCEPDRPTPVLAFHGTADPILYFNGGIGDLSVVTGDEPPEEVEIPEADLDGEGYPETARRWAELNGCAPEATDDDLSDELIDRTWSCPPSAAVEFVIVRGGGHSWPGSAFSQQIETIVGPTTDDIAASDAAWEFFQRYQRTP